MWPSSSFTVQSDQNPRRQRRVSRHLSPSQSSLLQLQLSFLKPPPAIFYSRTFWPDRANCATKQSRSSRIQQNWRCDNGSMNRQLQIRQQEICFQQSAMMLSLSAIHRDIIKEPTLSRDQISKKINSQPASTRTAFPVLKTTRRSKLQAGHVAWVSITNIPISNSDAMMHSPSANTFSMPKEY